MSDKIKIVLKNQNKLLLNHLWRQFNQAVVRSQSNQMLQYSDVLQILNTMRYLSQEKEEKDYQLVTTIVHMLEFPKGSAMVSQRNLFHFLANINDLQGNFDKYFQKQTNIPLFTKRKRIEPLVKVQIGKFNDFGEWIISKQEGKQLRIVFKNMNYTNKARKNIGSISEQAQTPCFQPTILDKSSIMAQNRFKSLGYEQIVFNRLYEADKMLSSKIQQQRMMMKEKDLIQCTFRPSLILSAKKHKRVSSQPIDYSSYLFAKGRQNNLKRLIYKEQYLKHKNSLQLSQCSFKPDLSLSRHSLKKSLKRSIEIEVKNSEKSVERVRIGRQQRMGVYQASRRGYPQVESWTQFLQHVRNSRCRKSEASNNVNCQNVVILTISLKIFGSKKYLQVKQGDSLVKITERICKTNKIKQDNYQRISRIIQQTLIRSDQVQIQNGVILKKTK